MDDTFKIEYKKLTTDFGGENESESAQRAQSKPRVHKVVMSDLELEQRLILELQKAGVKPETKVPFDRPYKYSQPYFADIVIGRIVIDIKGKSSQEEVDERDKYFMEKKKLFADSPSRPHGQEVRSGDRFSSKELHIDVRGEIDG